ncbi:BTAD domain-containing putative transcriptional regulator [Saccharothrix sp. HUAS TT1]|uniref:AfsR/SARP family transcriptional regulator n=1 Tax=unclassified Saccharothrix TaxID=2593673 RepID=UPI00345C147E
MRPEVRVLGPVEVIGPGGRANLQGARQRAVAGVLALHAGTVVSRDRLVDVLWDDDPPRTAVKSLHSHVARVRQSLSGCGLTDVLRTSEPGYVLMIEPEAVDAHRFARVVATARAAPPDDAEAVERLRAALASWRGPALADAGLVGWGVAEVERWHELRLTAWEHLWAAELRRGRHHVALPELERLLVAHPTRERLVGLYMLALYRCERQVEALEAYRRLAERLADELGVDPGAELSRLHTDILRRSSALDPPRPDAPDAPDAAPAQLPARAGHFTGRAADLSTLDRAVGEDGEWPVVSISGPGGMGKTSLAVQWAHRVAGRFPDGQLFLDLHGHDPAAAMTAAEALAHLLLGLGVPDSRVPATTAARAGLYRSVLYGRRVLVLLDNCGDAADLAALVPGGTASLLLITGRAKPASLMVRHAVCAVSLDALSDAEALTLLGRVLGAARVEREHRAATRLVRLCGGMPLALRIAAAKLVIRSDSTIEDLADELAADRLDSLAVEGDDRSVRAVIASAYRTLSAPAARAFRLLGSHPGPHFPAHLVAAACGVAPAAARPWIEELVGAHMIVGAGDGRYRFHDLVRLFAQQRGTGEEPALARVVDFYLALAREAADLPDRHAALATLDAERENLLPVVRAAGENGLPAAAWQLTAALTGFFDARGHWTERIEMCRVGVAAAAELGDPAAEGEMLRSLGTAYRITRHLTEALDCYPRALELMRAADDRRGEAAVHNNIGGANVELRRFDAAVAAYRQAIALHAATGNRRGIAVSQRNLGYTYVRMGRPELSFEPLGESLANARADGDLRLEAGALDTLGEAYLLLDDVDHALEHFRAALVLSRRVGDRRFESETLTNTGIALLGRGDPGAALVDLRQALAVSAALADRHGESVVRANLGRAHLALGDLTAAREEFRRALAIRERLQDGYEEARLHDDLAEVEARSGRPDAAARHRELARRLHGDPAVSARSPR